MTKEEFLKGWALLIAQPWGSRYARAESEMDRLTAKTQLDLYYQEFCGAEPEDWLKACRQHAKGARWPSIDDLRVSVRARPTPALPAVRGLTGAEFGETLFEAIKWAAAVQWIDQSIARAVLNDVPSERIADLRKQREYALQAARALAGSISDEDAAELARRYPWIL